MIAEIKARLDEGLITIDEAEAEIDQFAYEIACERQSPNSPDFEEVWEGIAEGLFVQMMGGLR